MKQIGVASFLEKQLPIRKSPNAEFYEKDITLGIVGMLQMGLKDIRDIDRFAFEVLPAQNLEQGTRNKKLTLHITQLLKLETDFRLV